MTYADAVSARQGKSVTAKLASLSKTANTWYDGTLDSVDLRLAALDHSIADLRDVVANDGQQSWHLGAVVELQNERVRLESFKHEALCMRRVQKASRDASTQPGPLYRDDRSSDSLLFD